MSLTLAQQGHFPLTASGRPIVTRIYPFMVFLSVIWDGSSYLSEEA